MEESPPWAWVCTCGAVIPRGPQGPHQADAVNAHARQHRHEVAASATEGWRFGPVPTAMMPLSDVPPPYAYQMPLVNLATGDVDPRRTFVVPNPAHEAFRWHGGTPYQITSLHGDAALPPLARLDRAIQDVERALALITQCAPPLPEGAPPDRFRQRLAQAVNGLCSAERDVHRLQDDLLVTHTAYEVDCLRQREYLPYEAQPMFHGNSDGRRYFNNHGPTWRGPLTIQEQLQRYGAALREAASHAAMAVLADESDMRQVPTHFAGTEYAAHLFSATSFADEEEGHDLERVRAIIAPDAPPLRVSVYVTQNRDASTRASGQLQAAGIPYWIRGTVLSPAHTKTSQGPRTEYEIFVRREDAPAAKAVLERT